MLVALSIGLWYFGVSKILLGLGRKEDLLIFAQQAYKLLFLQHLVSNRDFNSNVSAQLLASTFVSSVTYEFYYLWLKMIYDRS